MQRIDLKAAAERVLARNPQRNQRATEAEKPCNPDRIRVALQGLPMAPDEALEQFSAEDIVDIETGEMSQEVIRHFLVWRCYYLRKIAKHQVDELLAV